MSGYGQGAAQGLEQVLAELFLKQKQRQMMEQQQAELAQRASEADASAGLQRRGQDLTQGRWETERADTQAADAKKEQAEANRQQQVGRLVGQRRDLLTSKFVPPEMELSYREELENLGHKTIAPTKPEKPRLMMIRTVQNGRPVTRVLPETEAAGQTFPEYREPSAPRDERLVQVEGEDGRPTWVRESTAVGKPAAQAARAVTGAERGVLAYYNRAKDAEETISTPGQSGASLEDRVAKGGIGAQLGLQYAPNILQSSDQQAYRQAQRAFTEARLRKESGAAIPKDEYENDARTYFAQPGDSPATINLKRQKRQTVLEGLKFSSGRAYDEFYGESSAKPKGAGGGASAPGRLDPDALLNKYGPRKR